jgi:hypothetical protein
MGAKDGYVGYWFQAASIAVYHSNGCCPCFGYSDKCFYVVYQYCSTCIRTGSKLMQIIDVLRGCWKKSDVQLFWLHLRGSINCCAIWESAPLCFGCLFSHGICFHMVCIFSFSHARVANWCKSLFCVSIGKCDVQLFWLHLRVSIHCCAIWEWLPLCFGCLFPHGICFHMVSIFTRTSSHGSACHEKAVTAWEPKMAVLVTDFRQHPLLYTIAMDAALVLVTQTMLHICIGVSSNTVSTHA